MPGEIRGGFPGEVALDGALNPGVSLSLMESAAGGVEAPAEGAAGPG